MYEMLNSLTKNPKKVPYYNCFAMYNFVMKVFPQLWQCQLNLCAYPCEEKNMQGNNALSNVWKVKSKNYRTLVKITPTVLWLKISTFLKCFTRSKTYTNERFFPSSPITAKNPYGSQPFYKKKARPKLNAEFFWSTFYISNNLKWHDLF